MLLDKVPDDFLLSPDEVIYISKLCERAFTIGIDMILRNYAINAKSSWSYDTLWLLKLT